MYVKSIIENIFVSPQLNVPKNDPTINFSSIPYIRVHNNFPYGQASTIEVHIYLARLNTRSKWLYFLEIKED